jgi:hypothetical protein
MPTINQIWLPIGNHEVGQRMVDLKVEVTDDPLVRLVASIEPDLATPPGPGRHLWATTLAIRMDRAGAIALSQQIRELARTMGWPLPPEGGHQA